MLTDFKIKPETARILKSNRLIGFCFYLLIALHTSTFAQFGLLYDGVLIISSLNRYSHVNVPYILSSDKFPYQFV